MRIAALLARQPLRPDALRNRSGAISRGRGPGSRLLHVLEISTQLTSTRVERLPIRAQRHASIATVVVKEEFDEWPGDYLAITGTAARQKSKTSAGVNDGPLVQLLEVVMMHMRLLLLRAQRLMEVVPVLVLVEQVAQPRIQQSKINHQTLAESLL
jgi:hypothetical protein